MSNIISELGGLVTSQILKSAAGSLGESEGAIGKVIGALAPTILGGMLNKSSDSSGFGQIFDMLSNKDNSSMLDNLGGLIGGGNLAHNDPKDVAGGLLGSLFGDKIGGILDVVSSLAGVKKSSSSSLLGMVGPMIMGYLGKKILKEGLSAAGLSSFLGGQRNNIASAMPNQLADMIGFEMPESLLGKATGAVAGAAGAAGNVVEDVTGKAYDAVSDVAGGAKDLAGGAINAAAGGASALAGGAKDLAGDAASAAAGTAKAGGNMLMKILPLALLAAAALFFWKQCGSDVTSAGDKMANVAGDAVSATAGAVGDVANATVDAAGNAVNATVDAAGTAVNAAGGAIAGLGDFFKRKMANGIELNIPENGIESSLLTFLDGGGAISKEQWYNFDRLNFATGSASLDVEKSQEQLSNIAQIMKAYPNMNIKIGGYTDNTGSAEGNQRLSEARANTVKNAIANLGVAANRMTTEGYGIAHPVASNDTEEGRAQNRRIAVNVTKK